ncbi:MAG: DUF6516 family protein [Candidatus Omnitrophota bacterium]
MSIISDYILQIKRIIDETPYILSENLVIDNRGDIVLYLKGEIVFTDLSELHFKEYIITIAEFKKIAYSYHYQDFQKALIFRYDNAEHHPELITFPHHQHIGSETFASKEMSVEEVIGLIVDQINK